MKVTFSKLGRSKATFTTTVPALDHANLEAAARSQCQILSSEIAFHMNEEGTAGVVTAGFHNIGRFTVENDGAELN